MSKCKEQHGLDTEIQNSTPQETETETEMEMTEGSNSNNSKYHPGFKDGGYGWVIVASNVLIHFLFATVLRTFGILYLALLERYDTTPTVAGWIGALCMTTLGVFGPITSFLCCHLSCRTVTILGSVLNAAGLVITAFAPNIIVVFLSLGVLACAGASFTYVPGFILVNQYFDQRKALAMGLSTLGSGIGTFVTPPLIQYLFSSFGFSGTMLLLAGVNLHGCISGALQRPYPVAKTKEKNQNRNNTDQNKTLPTKYPTQDDKQFSPLMKFSLGNNAENIEGNMEISVCNKTVEENGLHRLPLGAGMNNIIAQNYHINEPDIEADFQHTDTIESYEISDTENLQVKYNFQEKTGINLEHLVSFKSNTVASESKNITKRNWKCDKCGVGRCFDVTLVTDPLFWGLFAINFSSGVAMCVSSAFMPALARDRGVALPKAAFLLSITGACDAATRLTAALILDAKFIRHHRAHVYNCANLLLGVGALATCFASSFPALAVATALKGIGSGLILSQRGTISADLMGSEQMSKAVGLMLLSGCLGALVGRGIGGVFKDLTGSYVADFYLSAAVTLACSLLFLLCLKKKKLPR